ncbi:tRNA lysidine(34) synthetase TilS [Blochmannia endosymbiont of Colobopsis nipponica]|uniref:tRNA lysidine(34) synthetase TilS n=1 Tax=Blochmannia endosymbiont of Colobopsis nipponica TaxID=2681987 RepID=UPI001780CBED|nr:tRNA lysidine(34) synthetase TilS [Blochmannia endosymbiont of Colobopsis nipponica]QOI11150.1 tRNA lysidine(34) synthetase TilS [Blochmannia endosymbiont of Colobopsis nipponica]
MSLNSMNCLFYKKLYASVASKIANYSKLVLAFSGGLDSTVLLSILTKLYYNNLKLVNSHCFFNFRVIHIHHGLSAYSDIWAKHCLRQCKKRGIPCSIIRIDCSIAKNKFGGIESAARCLRNRALFNNLNMQEVLLTAHHLDDQVETFLLALKRGSGPTGLSSMSMLTVFNVGFNSKKLLLRPLLSFSHSELAMYARDKQLIWIEDDSNKKISFDRNFLRIRIIPSFVERWPSFRKTVARSARICAEQESLLDELLIKRLCSVITDKGTLLFKLLINTSVQMRHALLRRWLKTFNNNVVKKLPSYNQLDCMWKEVVLSRCDANPILCCDGFCIRRFRDQLYVLPMQTMTIIKKSSLKFFWSSFDYPIVLPNNLGILVSYLFKDITLLTKKIITFKQKSVYLFHRSSSHFEGSINIPAFSIVRSPYFKEKVSIQFGHQSLGFLYIIGRDRGRSLKKLWQEFNVPPWLRNRIPLLFYDNKLIAAIGVFITRDGKVRTKNRQRRVFWLQNNSCIF